jgi:hypothetical protein
MSIVPRTLVLALVALASGIWAGNAQAQKAALVENIDEPGRNPYQASVIFNQDPTNCTQFVCTADFPAVPAGKRLVITYASALYGLTSGGSAPNVALTIDGNIFGTRALLPVPQPDGFNTYIVGSPITFYVDAGHQPTLLLGGQFVSPVSISAQASVSGYLVSAP